MYDGCESILLLIVLLCQVEVRTRMGVVVIVNDRRRAAAATAATTAKMGDDMVVHGDDGIDVDGIGKSGTC